MKRTEVNEQANAMTNQQVYEYVRDNATQEWYAMLNETNYDKLQAHAQTLSDEVVQADMQTFLTRWGNFKQTPNTLTTLKGKVVNGNATMPRTIINTTTDYGRDENGNPIVINNNPE